MTTLAPAPRSPLGRPLKGPPHDALARFYVRGALPIALLIGLVVLGMRDTFGMSVLTGVFLALSVWFVQRDAIHFGGLTFASCFVGVSAFVFGARALYVIATNDMSIIARLGVPFPLEIFRFVEAMAWVLGGMTCFIIGAISIEHHVANAVYKRSIEVRGAEGVDLSVAFIVGQMLLTVALAPAGLRGQRMALTSMTDNAYIYMLPTLMHGFNLYAFIYIARRWVQRPSIVGLVCLGVCVCVVIVDAYFMYNMSQFRGFYTVGIFTILVAAMIIFFRKVSVWLLVALFAFYPIFKSIGTNRGLSNSQMVEKVLLNPQDSYGSEGFERSFGNASDINMLDTLIASLNGAHRWHPYVLSYVYTFVHWVPRKMWPGKPRGGVLADVGYVHGIPYSPGSIGFFSGDGGALYMLVMMGLLGLFMRWWQICTARIGSPDLRIAVFASFLLTSLVYVRYYTYYAFYGFVTFFLPCLICDWLANFSRKVRIVR